MEDYGYEEVAPDLGGINEFESIKVILLEREFPRKYLESITKMNAENLEQAQVLGLDYKEIVPNHKEGGVVWKYAVVARGRDAQIPNEKVFVNNDEGLLDEPKYMVYGQIQQIPPRAMYESKWDQGEGGNVHGVIVGGKVKIARFLPNAMPTYDWKNRRPLASIPDTESDEHITMLREVEQIRQKNWGNVIDVYSKFTEEEALKVLEMSIAYRYLIGYTENGKFNYLRPTKGQSFVVRRNVIKNKYLELQAYGYNKITKTYDTFNYTEAKQATEMDEYIADMIIATKQASFAKRKPKAPAVTVDNQSF